MAATLRISTSGSAWRDTAHHGWGRDGHDADEMRLLGTCRCIKECTPCDAPLAPYTLPCSTSLLVLCGEAFSQLPISGIVSTLASGGSTGVPRRCSKKKCSPPFCNLLPAGRPRQKGTRRCGMQERYSRRGTPAGHGSRGKGRRGAASQGSSLAGPWHSPLRGGRIPLTGTYRPRGPPA